MRSIRYAPAPKEFIPELVPGLINDYEMHCDEYPGIYIMCQILSGFPMCDYSPILDDFYFMDGVIRSNWVIFFSCRPRDAERLSYVARRLKKYIVHIQDADGGELT